MPNNQMPKFIKKKKKHIITTENQLHKSYSKKILKKKKPKTYLYGHDGKSRQTGIERWVERDAW